MKRARMLLAMAIVAGATVWVACGDDDPTGPTVSSVQVDPATATLAPGGSVQLTATARDAGGNTLTTTVIWSSNSTAATVDSNGLVTAVAEGTAVITATAGGQSGAATITVVIPVASVEVTPAADTVRAGLTVTLTATPKDAGGNALAGRSVNWDSDSTLVATVDTSGVVTGVSAGTATITATSEGQSGSTDIVVWVGVTGSWTGVVNAPAGMCPLNQSITEDTNGDVTGTADLQAPCAVLVLTVTGTNNTGGVADSVELTFVEGSFVFNGNFDGVDAMTGLINGGGCTDCPTSFTRNSIAPVPGLAVLRREGAAPIRDPFLPRN